MKFNIRITETCLQLLAQIGDQKIQRIILKRIRKLANEPEKQGKMLVEKLSGFRSVRAAGRYRIIFRVERQIVCIYILAAGIRNEGDKKDVYAIARKLLKAGLLDPESSRSR